MFSHKLTWSNHFLCIKHWEFMCLAQVKLMCLEQGDTLALAEVVNPEICVCVHTVFVHKSGLKTRSLRLNTLGTA